MARKKTAAQEHKQLVESISKLSRTNRPSEILKRLSIVYEEYSAAAESEAEVDFWLKCSRACSNLSSGTEKWLYEMIDEQEEDDDE